MINRVTSLSGNIVQFCRYLRANGFSLGIEEESLTLRALILINYRNPQHFYLAQRAILCRSREQYAIFESLYRHYWKQLGKSLDAKQKDVKKNQPATGGFKTLQTWLSGKHNNGREEIAFYSPQESLSRKDFSSIPDEDVEELMNLIHSVSKRLAAKLNRRYQQAHRITKPDLRRTLRKNMRSGGELVELLYRRPKKNRVKLIMLCDVSRSMELYTAFLIQFMFAFRQVYRHMETFVFSSSLLRITTALKENNFRSMLELLKEKQQSWGGGTRIAYSLDELTRDYGRLLDSKTIVVIMSDGWDEGESDLLAKNMRNIQKKVKKIIWLNPHAGYPLFRPETAGMKAALPFINVLAPVHNTASLRNLAKLL
ncbi:MAG TPA: VWA domain-containing protein [Chitinophagaceae bacterium]|nr:VWA domain-containing protein [Chitinophagaceae bacterium]